MKPIARPTRTDVRAARAHRPPREGRERDRDHDRERDPNGLRPGGQAPNRPFALVTRSDCKRWSGTLRGARWQWSSDSFGEWMLGGRLRLRPDRCPRPERATPWAAFAHPSGSPPSQAFTKNDVAVARSESSCAPAAQPGIPPCRSPLCRMRSRTKGRCLRGIPFRAHRRTCIRQSS